MLENQIKKIKKVIEDSINPVMFFDCDTDGATSYLQLKNVFSKIKGFPMLKDFKKQKELVENNLNQEVDVLIIFDIPYLLDDFLKLVKTTNPNCKIVWVDHHPTNSRELIDKYDILHLNPLNYDDNDNRAASYLSYLISGKIEKNLEFAVLGSVADFYLLDIIKELEYSNKRAFKILFPNLTNTKKKELFDFMGKYKFNDKRVKKQREYWIRYLTYGAGLIKLKNFFDFLFKFKEDGDTLRAFKYIEKLSLFDLNIEINANKGFLFENYSNLMKKYSPILDKALNNDCDDNLYFFEYTGKLGFTKTLAEEISYKHSSTSVIGICFKKDGKENYVCSFRGNNFIVNSLVSNALNGLNGRGGGHIYAAGAMVNNKDFSKFKKRIRLAINSK